VTTLLSSEDRAFLRAIGSEPNDITCRLVYADWLEERNDPRSSFVRLQVERLKVDPVSPDHIQLWQLEQTARQSFDAYWLAHLDPPVWCVVGNIVGEHPAGPQQSETRHGTRLFRPNAKVYLASTRHIWAVFESSSERFESLRVVGQQRKSREWLCCWVRSDRVSNWRIQLNHHPNAMLLLRTEGWMGFRLRPKEFVPSEDRGSPQAIQQLLDAMNRTFEE